MDSERLNKVGAPDPVLPRDQFEDLPDSPLSMPEHELARTPMVQLMKAFAQGMSGLANEALQRVKSALAMESVDLRALPVAGTMSGTASGSMNPTMPTQPSGRE